MYLSMEKVILLVQSNECLTTGCSGTYCGGGAIRNSLCFCTSTTVAWTEECMTVLHGLHALYKQMIIWFIIFV